MEKWPKFNFHAMQATQYWGNVWSPDYVVMYYGQIASWMLWCTSAWIILRMSWDATLHYCCHPPYCGGWHAWHIGCTWYIVFDMPLECVVGKVNYLCQGYLCGWDCNSMVGKGFLIAWILETNTLVEVSTFSCIAQAQLELYIGLTSLIPYGFNKGGASS